MAVVVAGMVGSVPAELQSKHEWNRRTIWLTTLPTPGYDPQFVRNMTESALRIGLVLGLLALAYDIIRPFLTPILWGSIIAIAAFPLVKWLEPKLGGRRGLAAALVSLLFILALVLPTWTIMETLP